MPKYSMGFDFGSLSVRGLLVDIETGEEIETVIYKYPHGIMTEFLPDGSKLPDNFSIQHPQDYLDGIRFCSHEIIAKSRVNPKDIIGIGLDTTASSILPIAVDREPLCFKKKYKSNPHAWLKLWNHHGAIEQAQRLVETADKMQEPWLKKCGGIISSEWFLPKVIELAECAPDIYNASDSILEVADWLTEKLTGSASRSQAIAECNCCYCREKSYPTDSFFEQVSKKARNLTKTKFREKVIPLGERAGVLSSKGAEMLGLCEGAAVAVPIVDSHASVSASGANQIGDMVYICGTSAVEILLTDCKSEIPGVHISAQDVSIPGYYSLGSGQCSVGDCFSWFINNFVPKSYLDFAAESQLDIYTLLSNKAAGLVPGESGLIALDWWNGVRTPFFKFDLSGIIFGLSIHTKPEEIWRALLEAHAFNVKKCVDKFINAGHKVNRIFAAGGIPKKNPVLMQLLSDILQKDIYICGSDQTGALGSAIFGAAAAFKDESFEVIMNRMSNVSEIIYKPHTEYNDVYCKLFDLYNELSEKFGNDTKIFKILNEIRDNSKVK